MTLKALVFDIDGVLLDHESKKGHDWTRNIENDLNISKDIVSFCKISPVFFAFLTSFMYCVS